MTCSNVLAGGARHWSEYCPRNATTDDSCALPGGVSRLQCILKQTHNCTAGCLVPFQYPISNAASAHGAGPAVLQVLRVLHRPIRSYVLYRRSPHGSRGLVPVPGTSLTTGKTASAHGSAGGHSGAMPWRRDVTSRSPMEECVKRVLRCMACMGCMALQKGAL